MIQGKVKLLAVILALAVGCAEDMLPDYLADAPKVLALKTENPEIQWGETVRLTLLLGGKEIDQKMATSVQWFSGVRSSADSGFSWPYCQPLVLDETFWATISPDQIPSQYAAVGWFDFPVSARISINGKAHYALKMLRITNTPRHQNPNILGVRAVYYQDGQRFTPEFAKSGETLTLSGDLYSHLAVTAITEDPALTHNDQLVYRWYVSLSKNSPGKLYVADNDDASIRLLNSEQADEKKQSVVFSLIGRDEDLERQCGRYDIYLVVRDKAHDAQTRADDRLGLDFFYFTLSLDH